MNCSMEECNKPRMPGRLLCRAHYFALLESAKPNLRPVKRGFNEQVKKAKDKRAD